MEIENILKKNGIYTGNVEGNSMMPMLREGIDRVVIKLPEFPLKKYDVPLYRRDDHLTLHRIVRVKRGGRYIIRGDNRLKNEYDITDNEIVGVLAAVIRDDKVIDTTSPEFLQYSKKICRKYYIRKLKWFFKVAVRKLFVN